MEAVVLAGGKGSRLLPHTSEMPKPLVPVGDKPIVEILLKHLRNAGVTRVYMAVSHMAPLVQSVIGDGDRFGLEIIYSVEPTPLSTAGPLKLIDNLPDNFIVANADIVTDLDVEKLYQYHIKNKALLTVASRQREEKVDYGVLEIDSSQRITGFSEKPAYNFVVSTGIYVFSRKVLAMIPDDQPYGFDHLMLDLLGRGERVMSYPFDGYWLDVGRPDDYARAQRDFKLIGKMINLD